MKENEGKLDFLALVVKFGFEGAFTTAFCEMRWLAGVITAALNYHSFVRLSERTECFFTVKYGYD